MVTFAYIIISTEAKKIKIIVHGEQNTHNNIILSFKIRLLWILVNSYIIGNKCVNHALHNIISSIQLFLSNIVSHNDILAIINKCTNQWSSQTTKLHEIQLNINYCSIHLELPRILEVIITRLRINLTKISNSF